MNSPALHLSNRVAIAGEWLTWADLAEQGDLDLRVPVAVVGEDEVLWRALAAAVVGRGDVVLITPDRATDALRESLEGAGFVDSGQPSPIAATAGRITVATSGTTGTPKLIEHSLGSLATMAGSDVPARTWLVPYTPGSYAWYQLALLGLTVPAQSLVPVSATSEPEDWVATATRCGVSAISATPTFWRRAAFALGKRLEDLELKQVTLGGEPIDQGVLDMLRELFPRAQVSHIYAATETGACLAVHDGLAGFPRRWLDSPRSNGVELRVEGEQLWVRSPYSAGPSRAQWIATGDNVVLAGDRVLITGRRDVSFINVGGSKVDANEVRTVLMDHPDVRWANVRARNAPVVGEVPIAEVVLDRNAATSDAQLRRWSAERLPEAAVPRIIRVLDDVPITATGKTEVAK